MGLVLEVPRGSCPIQGGGAYNAHRNMLQKCANIYFYVASKFYLLFSFLRVSNTFLRPILNYKPSSLLTPLYLFPGARGWNLVHDHSGHQIFLKHDVSNPITMCKGPPHVFKTTGISTRILSMPRRGETYYFSFRVANYFCDEELVFKPRTGLGKVSKHCHWRRYFFCYILTLY